MIFKVPVSPRQFCNSHRIKGCLGCHRPLFHLAQPYPEQDAQAHLQPLWAPHASALSPAHRRSASRWSEGTSCVLVCAQCLLSRHLPLPKRAWLCPHCRYLHILLRFPTMFSPVWGCSQPFVTGRGFWPLGTGNTKQFLSVSGWLLYALHLLKAFLLQSWCSAAHTHTGLSSIWLSDGEIALWMLVTKEQKVA